ncbi:MAG: guanylate kinase [Eubacterium sp.]|jgi:guanylate kinase|nr:guanylate kinase [Eubacterium sp.]MEE3399309.1 guanylate kinase [Eubacterium sp.]
MKKGRLIVVSGFSGAGKGTVIKRLREKYDYSLSISATTRAPREGEEDGREYYFKTVDEFMSLIDYNGLIEWAQYVDNYYGTPRKFVEEEIAAGKNVILEIEVQGAMNIKSQYPDAILIFISTKDIDTLRERLTNRGTETPEVINKRIARAAEEAKSMESYEYIVINDDLEECVDTVNSIVVSQSCKKENRTEFLIGIKRQLDEM